MKLYVNEKLFSLHRKFYITNENKETLYEISSMVLSIGDATTINDKEGNKVAYINQEIFHLSPTYGVYIDGKLSFKIKKNIIFNDYTLSNGYRVDGNLLMFDFCVFDDKGNKIGSIQRKLFTIGDEYEIDIIDESEKNIILSIIVATINDVNRLQRRRFNDD